MGKIFDLDSPVMRALGRVGDLMIMNISSQTVPSCAR